MSFRGALGHPSPALRFCPPPPAPSPVPGHQAEAQEPLPPAWPPPPASAVLPPPGSLGHPPALAAARPGPALDLALDLHAAVPLAKPQGHGRRWLVASRQSLSGPNRPAPRAVSTPGGRGHQGSHPSPPGQSSLMCPGETGPVREGQAVPWGVLLSRPLGPGTAQGREGAGGGEGGGGGGGRPLGKGAESRLGVEPRKGPQVSPGGP